MKIEKKIQLKDKVNLFLNLIKIYVKRSYAFNWAGTYISSAASVTR